MREYMLQYWPKDDPIPEGWILVDDFADCHHGHRAILIEKIEVEAGNEMASD